VIRPVVIAKTGPRFSGVRQLWHLTPLVQLMHVGQNANLKRTVHHSFLLNLRPEEFPNPLINVLNKNLSFAANSPNLRLPHSFATAETPLAPDPRRPTPTSTGMALLNGPKPVGGPTMFGVSMKQASLITVR